jgi:DNA phosphorothioation-dependent restriction protein DptH
MVKECRKFGLSLILASQESKDFDAALLTAIANYLTLRVTEDSARHLAKMTVASERQRGVADRMKQLPKYHGLWLCEGRKTPVQIALRESERASAKGKKTDGGR